MIVNRKTQTMSVCVQVMGPFNTGTNLILRILEDHCVDETGSRLESSENMLFWKHTLRTDFIEKALESHQNRFIIIYKRVYNWVYSIYQNPYDISLQDGMLGGATMQGTSYDNLIMLYNRYYNMYKGMIMDHPDRVVMLDYGKMIRDPDYIVQRLQHINLFLTDQTIIEDVLSTPSKNHGVGCVQNAKEALEKYERVGSLMKGEIDNHPISASIHHDLVKWCEDHS